MNTSPLFAFFGTPEGSVNVLNALEYRGLLPALVISAPDAPRGRDRVLTPSPVKAWALERGIAVETPTTLKDPTFAAELRNTDWDLFLVASYGKLLPRTILDIPRRQCLNIHPSLLPRLRGPSPILSAILEDARETGVSLMVMGEKMDAGPVIAQAKIEIAPEDWPPPSRVLEEMLFTEGGTLFAEVLPDWLSGSIDPAPQDDRQATHTRKFTDADALLDLGGDPYQTFLKIRAFDVSPRAYFLTPLGKRVIVTEAVFQDGKLELRTVIPEGKKEMTYQDFLRGQQS